MDRGPIFLAGIERSGTSLMYALLASHPNLAMTRRTNLWTYFYNQFGDLSQPENFERCLAKMLQYKRLRLLALDPERIRHEFWQGETTYGRLFALLEQHYAERIGRPRWGDKSLNTEKYADAIFAAYPNARIIHMIRDPRDRYASARTRWKAMKGRAGAGTAMWLASVALARRNQQRYPSAYKILRYETLVYQPEETLRQVCEFIGEDYTPQMLTMEGAPRLLEKGSNSSYGPREPGRITPSSLGRYRQVLSKFEIAFIQSMAGKEMQEFEYSLDEIRFSPAEQVAYLSFHWPINFLRMAAWAVKETLQDRFGRTLPAYRLISQTEGMQA